MAGHSLRALRLSFVGELGWELHVPNDSAVPVYQAIMAAGKAHNIKNAGYRAIDSLSIEKGGSPLLIYYSHGVDFKDFSHVIFRVPPLAC